jgi:hypothetical protein
MSQTEIIARCEAQMGVVHSGAYEAMKSAIVEIKRLQTIIDKAKKESELIEHNGKPMVAVPYWFIKS